MSRSICGDCLCPYGNDGKCACGEQKATMTTQHEEAERLADWLRHRTNIMLQDRQAADLLERQAAEIERLKADRRVLQSEGKHEAPCARFCEATAFTIELRQAKKSIERKDALLRKALEWVESSAIFTPTTMDDKGMALRNNIKTELEKS